MLSTAIILPRENIKLFFSKILNTNRYGTIDSVILIVTDLTLSFLDLKNGSIINQLNIHEADTTNDNKKESYNT